MPLLQYCLLHWKSELTTSDVAALSMMEAGMQQDASVSGSGDATRGKSVFDRRCTGCHAMEGERPPAAASAITQPHRRLSCVSTPRASRGAYIFTPALPFLRQCPHGFI
jgi:hypothetical protein